MPKPPYVPTPEEISRACLEIQATWSDEIEVERRCGGVFDPAAVPIYRVRHGRHDELLAETAQ